MRALVFTAPGVVEVQSVPDPVPGAGEIMVDIAASGICGSELHGFRSVGMRVPPLVLGHEFVGTVADGRRVVVNPLLTCGQCDSCRRQEPQICRSRQLLGAHLAGGLAEKIAVPETAIHPLPDVVDFAAGSLIEPLANAVHAWSLVGEVPPRVGVIGAGTIGLLVMLVAARHGAAVTIADPSPDRQSVAARLGGEPLPELSGEFDVVVDAVGSAATRQGSLAALRPGGSAVWLGLAEDQSAISGHTVVRQEQSILGSFAYADADFAEAIELAPKLDLSWTHLVSLSESATAFLDLAAGAREQVKVVVVPDERRDEVERDARERRPET